MFRKKQAKKKSSTNQSQQLAQVSTSINDILPVEVMVEILSHLGTIDLRTAMQVCKYWHEMITKTLALKKQMKISHLSALSTFKKIQSLDDTFKPQDKTIVFIGYESAHDLMSKLSNGVVQKVENSERYRTFDAEIGSRIKIVIENIFIGEEFLVIAANTSMVIVATNSLVSLDAACLKHLEERVHPNTPILFLNVNENIDEVKAQKNTEDKIFNYISYFKKHCKNPDSVNIVGYIESTNADGLDMEALVKLIYKHTIQPELIKHEKSQAKEKKCSIM